MDWWALAASASVVSILFPQIDCHIYLPEARRASEASGSIYTFYRFSAKETFRHKRPERDTQALSPPFLLVVQDAESYQKLLELKERAEVVEILRQRLTSLGSKKGRSAENFFTEFFAKNNISVED